MTCLLSLCRCFRNSCTCVQKWITPYSWFNSVITVWMFSWHARIPKSRNRILVVKHFQLRELGKRVKVIRHVFGFGIEFLENKDIGIFGHFIVIDFNKRYSYHTYFSPISTSWIRRFGTGCIARNGEWRIFVNYSVFSALFPLKLHVLFEEGILGTPVQKDAVPPIFISKYHRWKPNSTTTDLCIGLSLF